MVTDWWLPSANSSRDVPIPERWQRFLLNFAPTIAPNLHFAGLLEAWACPYDDGRMWILGIHSSESSLDEGLNTWLAATGAADSPTGDIKLIRSYAGLLADIAHNIPGTSPRSFETDAAAQTGSRWVQLTRWRVRADAVQDSDRFAAVVDTLGPLIAHRLGHHRPALAWVADTGDETVTIVAQFTSASAYEAAWAAMRQPGELRDATEHHLILTELVGGAAIELFALAAQTQVGDIGTAD
jgi:hypothetical protein